MASPQSFMVAINLNQNELQNAVIQVLGSDPSSPVEGQFWYNSTEKRVKYYDSNQVVSTSGDIEEIQAGSNRVSISGGTGPTTTIDIVPSNIDHNNLANTGSNTHSQIDSHIASTSNPHQVSLEQARTQNNVLAGDVNIDGNKIVNLGSPSADGDATPKSYVDGVAQGLDQKQSGKAATDSAFSSVTSSGTGVGKTLTSDSNGTLTVDGISTWTDIDNDGAVNDPYSSSPADRVLVRNQSTGSDNGVYVVKDKGSGTTPFVLERAIDADQDGEVTTGLYIFISEGTANANTSWRLTTTDSITVDTTSLTFAQFSGAGQISAGDGMTKTGDTLDVVAGDNSLSVLANSVAVNPDGSTLETDVTNGLQIVAQGVTGTQLNTSVAGTGLNGGGGNPLSVVNYTPVGGTTVVRKYIETGVSVGNTLGAQTITHNLGTRAVHVTVYDASTYEEYELEVFHTDASSITIDATGSTRTVDVVVSG